MTALEQRLRAVEVEKSGRYEKRTDHIDEQGNTVFINRLILEDSPYLLQHAHNPVNWYAWGDEAFEAAARENKPVFLSIGYSTCHWCHVMEVESFDSIEVAKLLNQHFISIKMDREQYPDIDEIYMTGVQLMSGHGGWPMSNFLMSDGKPFFGATYFPPENFLQLLQQIAEAWDQKREELASSAESIQAAIERILNPAGSDEPTENVQPQLRSDVLKALFQREDRSLGGLAGAPKFPQEPILHFLLDQVIRHQDGQVYGFLSRALQAMGRGGIYDQVGGGFHRYSVDEEWLVPHFEKMLYNQSQLAMLYVEAYRLSGDPYLQRIAIRTLDYVLRDMQLPQGGFYSATDADSEGEEGTFFLWTQQQLQDCLGVEYGNLIIEIFNASRVGNFEGSNILHLDKAPEDLEKKYGEDIFPRLDQLLETLYKQRENRVHPLRDDKLIVAWCAAMSTTLAQAAQVMGQPHWLEAAERAVALMLEKNLGESGELQRIYLDGDVSISGQLEDYANLIQALLMLFDITAKREYLANANQLMQTTLTNFLDESSGLFYLGPAAQQGPQIVRSVNASDGATLSPVATLLECLFLLQNRVALLGEDLQSTLYQKISARCQSALMSEVGANALSHTSMLRIVTLQESGSVAPIQYAGNGVVRLEACKALAAVKAGESSRRASICLRIRCAEGWHLTAPGAQRNTLAEVKLRVAEGSSWQQETIEYPQPHGFLRLPMEEAEVPIYKDEFELTLDVEKDLSQDSLGSMIVVELDLQLCSDEQCLLPQHLQFVI